MNICGKRMYSLLEKLNFERLSTFEGEKKAAEILVKEIEEIGLTPVVETFKAPRYTIKTAKLEVTEPFYKEYEVSGYGFAGNDAADGIEADIVYLEAFEPIDLVDVKGKIVFVAGGLRPNDFKILLDAGVKGAIATSGGFLDTPETADLDRRMLRPMHIEHGKLPTVCMRMKDAMKMIAAKPEKVKLTLEQEEGEADSQNVMVEIPGTEYPDEVIVYTAHYDSVVFSHGMFDNATGTATILEILRYYHENAPKRTLRFIWCGSEEQGLLGSKAYVAANEELMDKIILCQNFYMTGTEIGRHRLMITANDELKYFVKFLSKEVGFITKIDEDVHSSDSTPFAHKGVPAIGYMRDGQAGGHSRFDVPWPLSAKRLAEATDFAVKITTRLDRCAELPFKREICPAIKEKLENYLHPKD